LTAPFLQSLQPVMTESS